jgi:hypothetical protein
VIVSHVCRRLKSSFLTGGMIEEFMPLDWQHSYSVTCQRDPLSLKFAAPIVISKEGSILIQSPWNNKMGRKEDPCMFAIESQWEYTRPRKKKAVILINILSDSYDGIHTWNDSVGIISLLSPQIMAVLKPSQRGLRVTHCPASL